MLGVRFPHIPRADRPQVVTADVTRLYTHIPHQDLIQSIRWIIDTVFNHQNQPLLRGPTLGSSATLTYNPRFSQVAP